MTSIASVAFAPQIAAAAARHGIAPALLAAVAAQETGGPGTSSGANIVGDGGHGHGLFQIDDRSHAFASTAAALDPAQNADYAAGLLGGLLKTFGGNVRAALSAYNSGSPTATGTVTTWGNGARLGYADSVLAHEALLTGSRDGQMPDLAATTSSVNELQTLAAAAAAPSATAASSANATSSAASALSSMPAPSLPPPPQPQTSAQQAQAQQPLAQDYYADGDDAGDTKGA